MEKIRRIRKINQNYHQIKNKNDVIEKLLSRVEKLKSQYANVKKRNNNMKKKIIELEKESELYKDYCRNITHVKWSD